MDQRNSIPANHSDRYLASTVEDEDHEDQSEGEEEEWEREFKAKQQEATRQAQERDAAALLKKKAEVEAIEAKKAAELERDIKKKAAEKQRIQAQRIETQRVEAQRVEAAKQLESEALKNTEPPAVADDNLVGLCEVSERPEDFQGGPLDEEYRPVVAASTSPEDDAHPVIPEDETEEDAWFRQIEETRKAEAKKQAEISRKAKVAAEQHAEQRRKRVSAAAAKTAASDKLTPSFDAEGRRPVSGQDIIMPPTTLKSIKEPAAEKGTGNRHDASMTSPAASGGAELRRSVREEPIALQQEPAADSFRGTVTSSSVTHDHNSFRLKPRSAETATSEPSKERPMLDTFPAQQKEANVLEIKARKEKERLLKSEDKAKEKALKSELKAKAKSDKADKEQMENDRKKKSKARSSKAQKISTNGIDDVESGIADVKQSRSAYRDHRDFPAYVFDLFDGDGSGQLDKSEVAKALIFAGFLDDSPAKRVEVFRRCDADGDGTLSKVEFEAFIRLMKAEHAAKQLRKQDESARKKAALNEKLRNRKRCCKKKLSEEKTVPSGGTAEEATSQTEHQEPDEVDVDAGLSLLDHDSIAGGLLYVADIKSLRSQMNFRKNMYRVAKLSMKKADAEYSAPLNFCLAMSTFLGLVAASGLFPKKDDYTMVCLVSVTFATMAALLTSIRVNGKFAAKFQAYKDAEQKYNDLGARLGNEWREAKKGRVYLDAIDRQDFVSQFHRIYNDVLQTQSQDKFVLSSDNLQAWMASQMLNDFEDAVEFEDDAIHGISEFVGKVRLVRDHVHRCLSAVGGAITRATIWIFGTLLSGSLFVRSPKKPSSLDDESSDTDDDFWDVLNFSKAKIYRVADSDSDEYLDDVKSLLTQVYLRQNLLVTSQQHCDATDLAAHLGPIITLTGAGTLLGFLSVTPIAGDHGSQLNLISLMLMMLASTWNKIRQSPLVGRLDAKADTSRAAAIQYGNLASRLSSRLQDHMQRLLGIRCDETNLRRRHLADEQSNKTMMGALALEKRQLIRFMYDEVGALQQEERYRQDNFTLTYDPDDSLTEKWFKNGVLDPYNIDQPLSVNLHHFKDRTNRVSLDAEPGEEDISETVKTALYIGEDPDAKTKRQYLLTLNYDKSKGEVAATDAERAKEERLAAEPVTAKKMD